jgi:hypothetical protein
MLNAKFIKNFVSAEDCEYLISVATRLENWESGGGAFWDNRVLNYTSILKLDRDAAIIMLDANIRCGQAIKEEYSLDDSVYSDTLQVVRWFPGMEQPPHADDMTNTDINGFQHRSYGSIIYLNDSYSGGHTYYPNFNFDIKPEAGALAIHPGDPEHLHGVTQVQDGIRYTIASFWTLDRSKAHDWSIY